MSLIYGLDELYGEQIPLIRNLKKAITKFPDVESRLSEALSRGQIQSKLWLIESLDNELKKVTKKQSIFIEAGWYGTLAFLMFERATFPIEKIRSFDIDPLCAPIADTINKDEVLNDWRFKASTIDILNINYDPYVTYKSLRNNGTEVELVDKPQVIINTSCEHIEQFDDWINTLPKNTLIVLQSNNLIHHEHVNRVDTLDQFKSQCSNLKITFADKLFVEAADYTRFMIMGYK